VHGSPHPLVSSTDFLVGGGEMGELIRSHDWSGTSLGPSETWPQSLRTCVSILLNSKHQMFMAWGLTLFLSTTMHIAQSSERGFQVPWDAHSLKSGPTSGLPFVRSLRQRSRAREPGRRTFRL
jgi:hypothetical protein